MPAPLGVASSLFLYSVIPSFPFVGYSIAVPTILSLRPVADGCSPHILLYLLASYVLSYLFLLFSFSIALFPLPGFSCFHRLEVKLYSLSSLFVLHLLSLSHAVVFLLLPAYAPDVLSSFVSSSTSSYLPLPLSSTCTSAPTFYAALAGVGVQSLFLLWLLCTIVVAWVEEQRWLGWTAEELQEIAEAQVRHARWRAEQEEERRKLLDGRSDKPAKAVSQQRGDKQQKVKADTETSVVPAPQPRVSVSSKRHEKEEEKQQSEDEDEILRYTRQLATTRRKEKEKREEKEQSGEVEDETEDEEDDEQQSESEVHEPLSPSKSSPSSSSEDAASEEEEEDNSGSEEEVEEQESSVNVEHTETTARKRNEESEDASENDHENETRSDNEEKEASSEQDRRPNEKGSGKDEEERHQAEPSETTYNDQYGGTTHAHSSRSAAAPSLQAKSISRSSAAPLPTPPQNAAVAEEQQTAVQSSTSQPALRRFSQPMARTTAVRQPGDIFDATVPLARALPAVSAALSATAIMPHAQLPPLPPMPLFAATAPITIPVSSLLPSPPPTKEQALATQSLFPPTTATFSSRTPPLPIVAVPLRRPPQLTSLSLQPPLPIAAGVFSRTTTSPSPPLPISPIPLSPKAFFSATSYTHSPSPPSPHSVVSPSLFSLTAPVISHPSAPAALAIVPSPLAETRDISAAPVTLPASPDTEDTVSTPVVHSSAASELAEHQRQPFVPAHSVQEMQLVAELKDVQQQRHQQQQHSETKQSTNETDEQQQWATQTNPANPQSIQQHGGSPQKQQHQQRLSGTGQFVVETSDNTDGIAESEPTAQHSVDQPAEAAVDEISFSDDEGGIDEAPHAHVAVQQAPSDGAAVIEQPLVVEEEVEEKVEEEVF